MPQRSAVPPLPPPSRSSSPISLLSTTSTEDGSTTSTEDRHTSSAPRLYLYARLRRGEPRAASPVAFKDLQYWLRVEHLPEAVDIPLSLSRISKTMATKYCWWRVFTRSRMFANMALPKHMLEVLGKLLMFFYRTYHEEKGFTSDVYDDVCAAIVHHTEHGRPTEPVDQTPWLMALVKYLEQLTVPRALEDREYTPGELRVAQELVLKLRSYEKGTWEWPCLTTELARSYEYGERVGVTEDPRHASPFVVDPLTLMPLPEEVEALIHHHLALWCIEEGKPVPPML